MSSDLALDSHTFALCAKSIMMQMRKISFDCFTLHTIHLVQRLYHKVLQCSVFFFCETESGIWTGLGQLSSMISIDCLFNLHPEK